MSQLQVLALLFRSNSASTELLFADLECLSSSFKVIVIIGVILVSLVITAGGADGHARGFEYWRNPG